MIKSIKIQNYKLFKSFSLEDLPGIVLIGGKNNCGKTSVLESLFMSLDCGDPTMFMKHLSWRGLRSFNNNAESLFAPAFHNFNLEEPIVFEYFIRSSKKKLSYKFLPLIDQPFEVSGKNIELKEKLDSELGKVEISYGTGKQKAFLKLETNGMALTNTQFLLKYNERVRACFLAGTHPGLPDENARKYGELDRVNKTEEILNGLRVLEPELRSLSLIPMGGKPIIYGDTGMGAKIPLALMGQGMARLASILLAISEVNIVLIDELENGFHHSVLPRIWKAITSYAQANETQIIATTHSLELTSSAVKGIPENFRDDFRYMRIEREKDEFKTKNYNFEDLKMALSAELEIR